MPDCTTIDISELKLSIPKSDLPLKSDVIIGYQYPELKLQTDECDYDTHHVDVNGDYAEWHLKGIHMRDYGMAFEELKELVIKYKGLLIAEGTDPRSEGTEYTRIRFGAVKKVKLVEVDE